MSDERGTRSTKSPDAFRTISEVSEELGLPQQVLRFWETKFSQIQPLKRRGGRRYYRPDDLELLRGIQDLLHVQGYTIKGVQKLIKGSGVKALVNRANALEDGAGSDAEAAPSSDTPPTAATRTPNLNTDQNTSRKSASQRDEISSVIDDLKQLRDTLRQYG